MDMLTRLETLEKTVAGLSHTNILNVVNNGEEHMSVLNSIAATRDSALEQDVSLVRRIDAAETHTHLNALMLVGVTAAITKLMDTVGIVDDAVSLTDEDKQQMDLLMVLISASASRALIGLDGVTVAEKDTALATLMKSIAPITSETDDMQTFDFTGVDTARSVDTIFGPESFFAADEDDDIGDDVETDEDFFEAQKEFAALFDGNDDINAVVDVNGAVAIEVTGDATQADALAIIAGSKFSERACDLTPEDERDITNIFADDSTVEEDTATLLKKPTVPNVSPDTMAELMEAMGLELGNVDMSAATDMARVKLIIDEDEAGIVRESVRLAMQLMDEGRIDANDLRVLTAIFTGEGADELDADDYTIIPAPGSVADQFSANTGNDEMFTVVLRDKRDVIEVLICIYVGSMARGGYIPTSLFALMDVIEDAKV